MSSLLLQVLILSSVVPPTSPRTDDYPRDMYCGGNQLVFQGKLVASKVEIVVVDPSGAPVQARIQVEAIGTGKIIVDKYADEQGRAKLGRLRSGKYWLGVSARGFNLHYWRFSKSRSHPKKILGVTLSVGT